MELSKESKKILMKISGVSYLGVDKENDIVYAYFSNKKNMQYSLSLLPENLDGNKIIAKYIGEVKPA